MSLFVNTLESLCDALPEVARDVAANLRAVLTGSSPLSEAQRWGAALACAYTTREPKLVATLLFEAEARAGKQSVEDARAAALAMATSNVFYRFRTQVQREEYQRQHPRLKLQRRAHDELVFELCSLSVSVLSGCAACVQLHERRLRERGLGVEQVNDCARIAATIEAAAVALAMGL